MHMTSFCYCYLYGSHMNSSKQHAFKDARMATNSLRMDTDVRWQCGGSPKCGCSKSPVSRAATTRCEYDTITKASPSWTGREWLQCFPNNAATFRQCPKPLALNCRDRASCRHITCAKSWRSCLQRIWEDRYNFPLAAADRLVGHCPSSASHQFRNLGLASHCLCLQPSHRSASSCPSAGTKSRGGYVDSSRQPPPRQPAEATCRRFLQARPPALSFSSCGGMCARQTLDQGAAPREKATWKAGLQ
mmetsp:Transcript_25771/g.42561  ORF Transcript_25771/g.42561 Transcript_25771/m.42561 type:complete len:246 (+) Transcript_25771:133-870(+)